MKRKFGFLYSGYSLHYWETAEMIRKLALATIPVFIKTQPTGSLQVCCCQHHRNKESPICLPHCDCLAAYALLLAKHAAFPLHSEDVCCSSSSSMQGSSWPCLHMRGVLLQAVLGEIVLVAYLLAVTYWRPYIARADNLLAMGSLFGEYLCMSRV